MKKRIVSLLLLFAVCLTGCGSIPPSGGDDPRPPVNPVQPDETEDQMVTSIKEKNGRWYIDYRGTPFSLIGGQLRTDGLMNRGEGENAPPDGAPAALEAAEIEPYIAAAKSFGLNCVQLALDWRDIEPQKDVYDFSVLDTFCDMLDRHDMKAELLWFSTNMCGDTHSFHLPDYVYEDEENYPRLSSTYDFFNWMYGEMRHFRLDSPALMEREAKVCTKITDHLWEYNAQKNGKYPIIGIQVHNEADSVVRWRCKPEQADLSARNDMTEAELWQMTLNALDNAGKAFKAGKYKVYTRCNMTVSLGSGEFKDARGCAPTDVLALEGIDIIGDDPYTQSAAGIASVVESYTLEGNYPHIAENMGAYASTPSLMLSALCAGGGYCIYDFATPEFFVWMNDYYQSNYQMDQGVLHSDLTEKEHSRAASVVAKGLAACSGPLAVTPVSNMAAFNHLSASPARSYTDTLTVGGKTVGVKTSDGSIGFVLADEDGMTFFSTGETVFTVEGLARVGYTGAYDGETFVAGEKVFPAGDDVHVTGVVRVTFR